MHQISATQTPSRPRDKVQQSRAVAAYWTGSPKENKKRLLGGCTLQKIVLLPPVTVTLEAPPWNPNGCW
eukprot:4401334-Amphidinium_carterae.1